MREPAWRRQGQEPDYRFSLANERTFLAWMRTALALLAGAVLLDEFATQLGPRSLLVALAAVIALLAAGLCALAYVRWRANEIAMRLARPLPATAAMPLIAIALAAVAGVIAWLVVLR